MEKERQDLAELLLARPRVNLEYLSENTNFYGIATTNLCPSISYFFGLGGNKAFNFGKKMSSRILYKILPLAKYVFFGKDPTY